MLSTMDKTICSFLAKELDIELTSCEGRIYQGSPVWFLNGNPVVGYSKQDCGIRLLFWNGQTFNEELLVAQGIFKAEFCFTKISEINFMDLNRWIHKISAIQ